MPEHWGFDDLLLPPPPPSPPPFSPHGLSLWCQRRASEQRRGVWRTNERQPLAAANGAVPVPRTLAQPAPPTARPLP